MDRPSREAHGRIAAWLAAAALLVVPPVAGSVSERAQAGAALPRRLTFEPVADATVRESSPGTNYGSTGSLEADGSPRKRAFLMFDVQGTAGQAVYRARLRLHGLDPSPRAGRVLSVPRTGWGEEITWNTQPALDDELATIGAVEAGVWTEVGLGATAVDGDGRAGFAILTASTNGADWTSRETDTPPSLILDLAPRIAAAGDIACDPDEPGFNDGAGSGDACRQRATSSLLVQGDYAAVLALGDTQYEDGTRNDYDDSYEPTWGRVLGITHPTPGNHEYHTANATGYFAYFGARAGDPDQGWYSFDIGTWHVIVLNSNCGDVGGCGPLSAQYAWLEADLAADDARCALAFMHAPRFSSGSEHGNQSNLADLWAALDVGGVDVVLAGHDHDYERFARQDSSGTAGVDGIREFVVGTGGRGLRPFGTVKPNSQRRSASALGVLQLVLKQSAYRWRFVAIGNAPTFGDSGETSCR